MSILSEAWRRAHGGDARLSKTLGAPAVSLQQRSSLLPWLLCGLLVALAVGLGVYIWLDQSRPPPPPVLAATAVAPQGGKAATATPQPEVAAPLAIEPKTARPASPTLKRRALTIGPASVSPPAVVNAEAQALGAPPVQEATAGNKAAPPSKPIALTAAPDAIRTAFPTLDIVVHVWNANSVERFIVIGARQFHVGDEIAPGVRLLDITRGGEIVGFRGYRLILP